MRDSVTVHMQATPAEVWDLVSDVTKIGRYSPETFGHVKRNGRGPTYWAPCVITACVPEREFGFVVGTEERAVNTWRYVLAPAGDGTDVTESFELADKLPIKIYWALAGWAHGKTNRKGMQATLDAMKAELERPT